MEFVLYAIEALLVGVLTVGIFLCKKLDEIQGSINYIERCDKEKNFEEK